jgi:RNA polymerase sigma factor (sigma-70 family)
MTPPMDADIEAAKRGDRAALDRVLTGLHGRLERTARLRMGAPLRKLFNTSDLLQSAYVDVVRGIETFSGSDRNAFLGWVIAILDRTVQDRLRWLGAGKRASERKEPERGVGSDPPRNRSSIETPSRELSSREDIERVRRALRELPEDQRRAVELKVFEGLDHESIARALERSPDATRSLLLRSRAALLRAVDRLNSEKKPNPS